MIKEEESEIPMSFEQSVPEQSFVGNAEGLTIEELPSVPENQERSIVLFNSTNMPLLQSPSNFSISVNPDLISGLKSKCFFPCLLSFMFYRLHRKFTLLGFCETRDYCILRVKICGKLIHE